MTARNASLESVRSDHSKTQERVTGDVTGQTQRRRDCKAACQTTHTCSKAPHILTGPVLAEEVVSVNLASADRLAVTQYKVWPLHTSHRTQ